MSILTETGQIRTIDTRAITPFYEIVGSDESFAHAERIVDSVWIRGCVPDDASYVEGLRELIGTTAQMAAESGYDFGHTDVDFINRRHRAKHDFTTSFLSTRGLEDELVVGKIFNVGKDMWDRWTYRERLSLQKALDGAIAHDEKLIDEPSDAALNHLNSSGVISSGIMRMLREAAFQGYLWGHGNPQPLIEKVELISMSDDPHDAIGYYDPVSNRVLKPLPIDETMYKRSLETAKKARDREARLHSFFDSLIA